MFQRINAAILICLLTACTPLPDAQPQSRTTNTTSAEFTDCASDCDAEKIAFLDEYLVLHSPVQATEFHIIYHDNASGRVPGPSDWSITAVMKVDPADIPLWTAERTPLEMASVDLARWSDLLVDDETWAVTSSPTAWQQGNVTLVVYEEEGVILFWSSSMG